MEKEILEFTKKWIRKNEIKKYYESKERGKEKYLKMKETDLYNFSYKLVDLLSKNMI